MTTLRSRRVESRPVPQPSKQPTADSSTEQPASLVTDKQLDVELVIVCETDGNDSATEDAATALPNVAIENLLQSNRLAVPILSTISMTEDTAPSGAQQKAIAQDTLMAQFQIMEDTTTDIVDVYLQGGLAEEFGCKAGVVAPDSAVGESLQDRPAADHEASATCDVAQSADTNPPKAAGDQSPVTSESQLAITESEADSSSESQEMTGNDLSTPIVVSDDETATGPVRRRPRKASKRSFNEYLVNDNLWMGQTLNDLDGFIESTRKHIKLLQNMEKRMVATRGFIQDCGGKEEKITQILERSA